MDSEQEIYKLLFENAGEGMIVTNDKGIIELVNPRLLKLFNYQESELIGKGIDILVPDAVKHQHQKHREGYTHQPKERRMGGDLDLEGKRKDGSVFSVEIGLNHCKINNKLKIVAIVTDISERVESQQKLKNLNLALEEKVISRTIELEKSQKLYSLIAHNFPKGIISVFDKQFNYVFIEGQELEYVGYESKNLIGKSYAERFKGELNTLINEKLNVVFNGEGISFEFELNNNFYVVNAVPLKSSDGSIEQALFIEKNITDSKLAQKEIQKTLEKEMELNEMKSRFVSMASHEFRTPLSTIMSSATLVGKYIKTDQQEKREKHLNRIKSSVKNLTSILHDFLSIDKLEDGKIQTHNSDFLVYELITEVTEEMEYFLKKEQYITINNYLSENQLVYSDRTVIKNILINLLSNAGKYSKEGEQIILNLDSFNKGIQIDIIDKGIGIPKKEQDKLFTNRFFRAGNVTNIEGTGLGLTIVKKYLSLIGGSISFKSEELKGSTFTIKIPNILL